MRIEQLRQVIEVAKTQSINRASQTLFIAQSSLSSSISSLERELGKDIFTRAKNRVEITEFGYKFIEEAKQMLLHYQIILKLAGEHESLDNRFGVSIYYLLFATRAFTKMCNDYDKAGRKVNFSFREHTRMDVILDVANGISEIGVITMPSIRKEQWLSLFDAYGLDFHILSTEQPQVVFGEKTELYHSDLEEIDIGFFKEKRLLMIEDSNEFFQSIDREVMQRFQYGSYLGMCDRGSYMTMLRQTDSYFLATNNKHAYQSCDFYEDLKSIPVTGMGDFHIHIAYIKRRGEQLSELGNEYILRLKEIMGL